MNIVLSKDEKTLISLYLIGLTLIIAGGLLSEVPVIYAGVVLMVMISLLIVSTGIRCSEHK